MKKIIQLPAICLSALAMVMTVPDASARRPEAQRPATTRPAGNQLSGARPGATRPGNGINHGTTRPGTDNGNRPGHNTGHGGDQGFRPGTTPGRPDNNGRPPQVNPGNPGHRPGGNTPPPPPSQPGGVRPGWGNIGPSFSHPTPPPPRPSRPMGIMRPVPRPSRPSGWIARPGVPAINGFLGLTFGTGLSVSLNILNSGGYSVEGFADNTVYLNNVTELSMLWPDAALYYSPSGRLESSSFYYSTPYNDLTRYNMVYSRLTSIYGTPVSTGSMGATWFGSTGFISLSYSASPTSTGSFRYFTTLSYGE